MADEEQFVDLGFPLQGIDQQAEVGGQPEGTVPDALNVRGLDPRTRRLRGASRSGLSRYVDERVGGLNSVIQHLAVIVDPTTEALLADADLLPPGVTEYPPDWVPWPTPDDPRFPLGPPEFPPGGSGLPPNPNRPPLNPPSPPPPAGAWSQLQFNSANDGPFSGTANIPVGFGSNVAQGSLLLVGVIYRIIHNDVDGPVAADLAVVDSLGNSYTAGTVSEVVIAGPGGTEGDPFNSLYSCRFFYAVAGSAGANTVTATVTGNEPSDDHAASVAIWEFGGDGSGATLEGQSVFGQAFGSIPIGPVQMITGSASQTAAGALAVALIAFRTVGGISFPDFTPADFADDSGGLQSFGSQPDQPNATYFYDLATAAGLTVEPVLDFAGFESDPNLDQTGYAAALVVFRRT